MKSIFVDGGSDDRYDNDRVDNSNMSLTNQLEKIQLTIWSEKCVDYSSVLI